MFHKTAIFSFLLLMVAVFITVPVTWAGELETSGILDAKNHQVSGLAHAAGNGTTDDTAALQSLIDYAFNNRLVLVLPAGTYAISNTLSLNQQAYKADRRYFTHQIVGSTKGTKPVIFLKPNSSGYSGQTASTTKPVVRIFATCAPNEGTATTCAADFDDARSIGFDNGIRNIKIQVGTGNPGAVALDFPSSQYSFIEDITIQLDSGFAGLFNVPGLASTVGNISIEGGKYGIYNEAQVAYTNNTTFTNISFKNQSACTISGLYSEKPITFAGFSIEKQSGSVMCGSSTLTSSMTFLDGQISLGASSSVPAFTNPGNKAMALINVFFKNAQVPFQNGTSTNVSIPNYQPNTWYKIDELYAYDSSSSKPALINGQIVTSPNPRIGTFSAAIPQATLLTNHSWGNPDVSPDHLLELSKSSATTGVCNAKSQSNILGNGTNNDQPGLQSLINGTVCKTIFLPKGRYYLGQTLTLDDQTVLAGLGTKITEFAPSSSPYGGGADPGEPSSPGNNASWKPTTPTAVITTVNDTSAVIKMLGIRIWLPTLIGNSTDPTAYDYFMAFDWRAGKNSIIKNVQPRLMYSSTVGSKPKPDVRFSGNAGGRWWGTNSIGISENAAVAGKRRLLVQNILGPLALYNYNIEDGWAAVASATEGWQSEILSSSNVAIYGGKFEDDNGIRIKNSTNIGIFGLGNSEMKLQWDSSYTGGRNSLWTTINAKVGRGTLTEQYDSQSTTISLDTPITLIKRGTFDRSAFTFTGSTGPTSTPTPTPSCSIAEDIDCSGEVGVTDLSLLLSVFGQSTSGNTTATKADFDKNGMVNFSDLNRLLTQFGT